MNFLITELSKYIILAVITLYCIESFWPLFFKLGDKGKGVYVRQYLYIFMIHTLGMVTLYLEDEESDPKYLFLWFGQAAIIFLVSRFTCILFKKVSGMAINHMCLFLTISFVMLSRIKFDTAVRQFELVAVSFVLYIFTVLFVRKFRYLQNLTYIYGATGLVLILLVLTTGRTVNGSKLSFVVMGVNFQASEFVKILFVLFIAGMLCETSNFVRVLITTALSAILIGLLALSKDLGSALIYYMALLVVVYVATGKLWYSLVGLMAGVGAAMAGYRLFSHVRVRFAVWQDPWSDIDKSGYQLTQSLFAIGTGNWFGLGLAKGTPESIPFVQEDFIFSAICEELGAVFGIVLILICLATFILFVKISLRTQNRFYKLVCVGLSVVYIMQVVLTIGGGTRFIPLTGVTLPLVSSGGSSCFSTVMMFGIIQGIVVLPKKRANKSELNIDTDNLTEEEEEEYEEAEHAEKKRRISAIIICAVNCLIIALMIANLVRFLVYDSEKAIANSYNNKRIELMASETYRGDIVSSDGKLLATTKVDSENNEIREYPYKDLFCHTVGYTGYGKYGIESSMNKYLIRSDISFVSKVSNDNGGVKNQGDIVYATYDSELQQLAYDLMGVYDGACVITEAKTGRILCMVSKPCFDANTISDNWVSLTESSHSPLMNRASQGLYPPGSTFKIITALEYIRENPASYLSYSYNCTGSITMDDVKINCFKGSVHNTIDLRTSLAKSCNSSFANIGLSLDRNEFADTLMDLQFNYKLPTAFASSASYCTMSDDMSTEAVMQTAIGQYKTTMTPLHLNMITAAIANGGDLYLPYDVDKVTSAEGRLEEQFEPVSLARVMTEEESKILTDMMTEVVKSGTASKLADLPYSVAGKTGSAEFNSNKHDSHAWFTGFAPAEDPEIVITIILEDAGTGGEHSVPIAKKLFNNYFERKNIK